jgi:RNA polymerase sigma-70 factor, ECF subfamily
MQRQFYNTYYPILMRICTRYAKNRMDAEQWVHDGFIKIFQSLPQFQHFGSFEGWLKRIMIRTCIDNIRAQSTLKHETQNNTIYLDDNLPQDLDYINNEALEKASANDIIMMLNTLPEKQKIVFNLYVFEDYSHKEIASLLHISDNNSYWLLHQARKQLKEKFISKQKKISSYE